jgi:hypothetical protein
MTHSPAPPALYQCLDCHAQVPGAVPEPPTWQWGQRQVPRLLCPHCGCGCAPVGWRNMAFEVCHAHAAQGMELEAVAHALWSGCPNSLACQQHGNHYAGNCEQAQTVMPKCLAALHSRLESLERSQARLETPSPKRPGGRQAGAAGTSADRRS